MSEPHRPAVSWPVAFAIVGVVAILAGAAVVVYVVRVTRDVPAAVLESGREALRDIREIAQAFRTGTVTTSFISYATEVSGSNYLQFATLKQVEVFERKDSAATFWGQLQLPDIVVRARVPVEYTYYVDFDKKWEFRLEGQSIRVTAPPIEYNQPALDASEIRFEVVEGSFFRSEGAALEGLRRGLTEASRTRARANVALVREMGRRRIGEFVEKWLARTFSDAPSYKVVVLFADEVPRGKPEAR